MAVARMCMPSASIHLPITSVLPRLYGDCLAAEAGWHLAQHKYPFSKLRPWCGQTNWSKSWSDLRYENTLHEHRIRLLRETFIVTQVGCTVQPTCVTLMETLAC